MPEQTVANLSAQIFYFLKDIGHKHQHHDRHTDTITGIYKVDSSPDSDLKWRNNTLYNMYRKIIDYKRHAENLNFNDCLGLLAYAEAFNKICEEELRASGLQNRLPVYYYKQVAASITATQSKIERKIEETQSAEDKRLNTLVAVFGLTFAYIGLMQFSDVPKQKPSPWLVEALSFFLMNPGFCIYMATVLLFTRRVTGLVHISDSFRDKYLRAFYPYSKFWPSAVLLLFAFAGGYVIESIFFGGLSH